MSTVEKQKNQDMEQIVYNHKMPIQLRFFDVDVFGHVNNTVYFQYYDTAKIDYIRQVCHITDKKYAIVTVHIDADFLSQVYIEDHVEVQTAVTRIGTKSFNLSQQLVDTDSGEVKCVGRTIMVAYDLEKGESIELLPEWIEDIEKYEGKKLK